MKKSSIIVDEVREFLDDSGDWVNAPTILRHLRSSGYSVTENELKQAILELNKSPGTVSVKVQAGKPRQYKLNGD